MRRNVQEVPSQPDSLERVRLHGRQNRAHVLEEDVADELAREQGRRVVAMEGMTVTLDAPLKDRAQQCALSRNFLDLTSTPNGWWQAVLDEALPRNERMVRWAEMAAAWLAERRRGR
jgi:hypothetical protein